MNRVVILDSLRFFAAFSVVLYHYTFYGYISGMASMMNFEELSFVFKYGHMGVELFFMISGFVILLSAEKKSTSHFVISRITRLYPAFWVGVTLTTLVIALYGGDGFSVTTYQYFINMTMINEVFHVSNIDGVYWTLFVEIRFYFLIFLVLLFRQMKNLKIYLMIWALISVMYYIVQLPSYLNFFLIPHLAPFFSAGSIFYMAFRDNKFSYFDYFILLLTFVSAVMYFIRKISIMEELLNYQFSMSIVIAILIGFYLLFYMISKRLIYIDAKKRIYKIMGEVTYPLYLIHAFIGYIIFNNLNDIMNKYVLLILIIILMIVLSYLIHITVERKFGKYMKNKMFYIVDKFMHKLVSK